MSDAHNNMQHRNYYNHWKILYLVSDLNYISFSNSTPNPDSTHLPKTKL